MQVGEQYLSPPKHLALRALGLLDLDDHLRLAKHLGRGRDDAGACIAIRFVVHADALAGGSFDNQLMPVRVQFARAARSETDPMLENFGLSGNADAHGIRGALCGCRNDAKWTTARVPVPCRRRLTWVPSSVES